MPLVECLQPRSRGFSPIYGDSRSDGSLLLVVVIFVGGEDLFEWSSSQLIAIESELRSMLELVS